MSTWRILHRDQLDAFKHSWPCHGLPDSLNSIAFQFAGNGDLVDINARDDNGNDMDSAEFDGPALVALSQDAQQIGAGLVGPSCPWPRQEGDEGPIVDLYVG